MKIIADLHIHSKHSRATSKDLSLSNLEKWGKIKGFNLMGTGDLQHQKHRQEIDEYLKEDEKGILWSDKGFAFLWQTEISLMYSDKGKRRAVHLVVLIPNKKIADKFTSYLISKGRIDYDGRPIFGIKARDFVKDLKGIDEMIEIIPAHVMTPWFGMFGSDSGFDSIKDCFDDQADKIYAVESGMSADPGMIYRMKQDVNVVSFSDAHSFWPWRIGREATIFDVPELSYKNIIEAIRTGEGLVATIETPPEYGKYHYDGHRNCNFSCGPNETKKHNGICPICKKSMTIGVENRIESLAKEKEGFKPKEYKPFLKLLPLHELISLHLGSPIASVKTWRIYNEIIGKFKNEFDVLLNVGKMNLLKEGIDEKLAELILLSREGKLRVKAGYDGEYGVVQMPKGPENKTQTESKKYVKQVKLF